MKKFILKIVSFTLFAAVFYLITLRLWESYAPSRFKPNLNYPIGFPGHMFSRLSEVKKTNDIDILFLGSSQAYRGFDTRIYSKSGLKTFNLGSSSQTPIQTMLLLKRYLENLNPKLVIYEVYPQTFMIDGVESSLDIIANARNDLYSFEMALRINNVKTYNTLLYGAINDLLKLNQSFTEPYIKDNDIYISGGFVEKETGYFEPTPFKKKEIIIRPTQLETFSQILSILKDKEIDVILVYAPIPQSNYKSYSNNAYFDSLMKSYSEYYNFNEIINLNDSLHFYDSNHLNQYGVEIFNSKLIEILNER